MEIRCHNLSVLNRQEGLWLHATPIALFPCQLEKQIDRLTTLVEGLGIQSHDCYVLDLLLLF